MKSSYSLFKVNAAPIGYDYITNRSIERVHLKKRLKKNNRWPRKFNLKRLMKDLYGIYKGSK